MSNRVFLSVVLLFFILNLTAPCYCFAANNLNLQKGISLFYQKNWDGAIEYFNEEIKVNPQDSLAYAFMLDAHVRRGSLIAYSNNIESQAEARGDDPLIRAQLGMSYFAKSLTEPGMADEAMQEFKNALKYDPQSSLAYTGMGMIYFQKRMMPRAKAHFLKAIQLNPQDIMAMELLGNILLVDDKKPDEALSIYNKITELCPNYPDAYYYIGSSCFDLGRYEEAIIALKKTMELDPLGLTQGYYAPVLLGDIYYKNNQYPEAIKAYEAALKINNMNSYVKYKMENIKNISRSSGVKN